MNDPIKLFSQGGSTSIHIDARITEEGDLLLSGQDIGEIPEKFFGDSDYEYWLTVPASEKDRLLLALLEKHYGGDSCVISHVAEMKSCIDVQLVVKSGPEGSSTSFQLP